MTTFDDFTAADAETSEGAERIGPPSDLADGTLTAHVRVGPALVADAPTADS